MPRVLEKPSYWSLVSPLRAGGRLSIPRDGRWLFNGDFANPTFTPSVNESWEVPPAVEGDAPNRTARNHYIITDGWIQFLSDSTHELAGQEVELPEFPPEVMESHVGPMD